MPRTRFKTLPIADIARDYVAGDSMETLARRYKAGYGTIRRILAASQVPIRGTGRHNGGTEAQLVPVTYKASKFWGETPGEKLHPQEIARLRRAVGWEESWAGPYDAINGD